MNQIIINAIKQKNIIQFNYHHHLRIVEPHVLGISRGKIQIECYQVGGSSKTGSLPNWRRFSLNDISDLSITDEVFPGKRPYPSEKHSPFDTIVAIVK